MLGIEFPEALLDALWSAGIAMAFFSAFPISFVHDWTKHGKMIAGINVGGYLPKKWFSHFYLYGMIATWLLSPRGSTGRSWLIFHLFRRFLEQFLLFPPTEGSRMHASAYLFGFVFYTGVALTIPVRPLSFTLFVIGNVLQFLSHQALFMNRWTRKSQDVKKSPPESFLFRYMNCPHYFAEMLIYASLISPASTPSILAFAFVVVSLGINWRNQSLWYRSQLKKP